MAAGISCLPPQRGRKGRADMIAEAARHKGHITGILGCIWSPSSNEAWGLRVPDPRQKPDSASLPSASPSCLISIREKWAEIHV